MKHNYICIVGALPFGIFGYIWISYAMMFTSFIGVIFHMHPNNNKLKYMDLAINSCFSINASVYHYKIMSLVIFSAICYILNNREYNNDNTNKTLSNIRHVLLVQLVGLYGYYLLYKHESCIEFYFVCEDNMINY